MAQTIFSFENKYYMVENNGYSFNQLDDYFAKDSKLYSDYKKAKKSYNTFRSTRTVFVGSFFLGFGATILGNDSANCDGFCISEVQQVGLITLLIVTPLTGIASLIMGPKSIRKRKNVIDQYNQLYGEDLKSTKSDIGYVINGTNNGIGITIVF